MTPSGEAAKRQVEDRVRSAAASEGPASEVERAAELRDRGTSADADVEALKTPTLATH